MKSTFQKSMLEGIEVDSYESITGRSVLDTAKGVLIALYGFGPETAFAELARVARTKRCSVFAVAETLLSAAAPEAVITEARSEDLIDPQWREDLSFRHAPTGSIKTTPIDTAPTDSSQVTASASREN